MITFAESDWIELDLKTAGIDINIKPDIVMGKHHGFLWIKEKSLIYSFGDNSYGQLGDVGLNTDSVKTLHKVSSLVEVKEICALDTFTAMINAKGDLYVSGLFMVIYFPKALGNQEINA